MRLLTVEQEVDGFPYLFVLNLAVEVFVYYLGPLLGCNIASEQRAKVVYEYLYRQIEDKKVRETIDFLLNREEAHNQMFRDAFNEVQDSGSNQDFGTTKAAKMYFSLSNPGPNAFAGNEVSAPKFAK